MGKVCWSCFDTRAYRPTRKAARPPWPKTPPRSALRDARFPRGCERGRAMAGNSSLWPLARPVHSAAMAFDKTSDPEWRERLKQKRREELAKRRAALAADPRVQAMKQALKKRQRA